MDIHYDVHFCTKLTLSILRSTVHTLVVDTHALIKLFIAAMAYYINTLDSQSSGRGRCGPNYFKVGDLF